MLPDHTSCTESRRSFLLHHCTNTCRGLCCSFCRSAAWHCSTAHFTPCTWQHSSLRAPEAEFGHPTPRIRWIHRSVCGRSLFAFGTPLLDSTSVSEYIDARFKWHARERQYVAQYTTKYHQSVLMQNYMHQCAPAAELTETSVAAHAAAAAARRRRRTRTPSYTYVRISYHLKYRRTQHSGDRGLRRDRARAARARVLHAPWRARARRCY